MEEKKEKMFLDVDQMAKEIEAEFGVSINIKSTQNRTRPIATEQKYVNSTKSNEKTDKVLNMIDKNVKKRADEEEKRARKEREEQNKKREELTKKKQEELKKKEYEELKRKKQKTKKKINGAKTNPNRLTYPKKDRSFLNRFHHLLKYEMGDYEFIEESLKEGTVYPSDFEEIQDYEDVKDDVSLRKGWNGFRAALAVSLLSASIVLGGYTVKQCNSIIQNFNQKTEVTTEQTVKPSESRAHYYFLKFQDQEYLSELAGVEETDTDEIKYEKMKSTYDSLPENISQYMRDPERILEIQKRNEEKNKAKTDVEDSEIDETSSQNDSNFERE